MTIVEAPGRYVDPSDVARSPGDTVYKVTRTLKESNVFKQGVVAVIKCSMYKLSFRRVCW